MNVTNGRGAYDRIDRLTEAQFDPLPRVVSPELCPSHFSEINGLGRCHITGSADRERHSAETDSAAVPLSPWRRYAGVLVCLTLGAAFVGASFVTDQRFYWLAAAWCVALAVACLVIARGHPHPI
jgi:hypothetical protein